MAKFINTRAAGSAIEELIRNAGERLILVSPYLKLSKDFRQLLEFRNKKDKVTTVIFGKQELKPDEMTFLQGLQFLALKFNEDLHAKCYVNDDKMIITSLNLYEFSMMHNKEMGVLIDKNDPADSLLFQEAMNEVDFIQTTSERFAFSAHRTEPVKAPAEPPPPIAPAARTSSKELPSVTVKPSGYCIYTGVEVPFNIEKPMSYEAYKRWKKSGGIQEEPAKFCHFTGEPSEGATCVKRPILKKNWKAAQAIHGN